MRNALVAPALSLAGLVAVGTPTWALTPADLCTGNPCVIESVFIDENVDLQFGPGTDLEIAPGATIRMAPGRAIALQAGSITMHPRSTIRARSASVNLTAETGAVLIGAPGGRARIDARNGSVGLVAETTLTLHGRINARGKEGDSVVSLDARGDVLVSGTVDVASRGGFGFCDLSILSLDGDIRVDGRLGARSSDVDTFCSIDVDSFLGDAFVAGRIRAGGPGGTDVSIGSDGLTEISGRVESKARGPECESGTFEAFGDVVRISGRVDFSNRGAFCFESLHTIEGTQEVDTSQGELEFNMSGAETGFVDVNIQSDGLVRLGDVQVRSQGGSMLAADTQGQVIVEGTLDVRSNGHGFDASDGIVTITGDCGIDVAPAALVTARSARQRSGDVTLDSRGGPITVRGDILASSFVDLFHPLGLPPVVTGTVVPTPFLAEGSTLPLPCLP